MVRRRRVKSVKVELVKKAREAMLAAVQIYNNPQITFKAETFITLAIIGWTYLLHAYYRGVGVDYRQFKWNGKRKKYIRTAGGACRLWGLEDCLDDGNCALDEETKMNLRFLVGVRHEIEHRMTNRIDEFIGAKLQACAINFDFYISKFFGERFNLSKELSLAIQFSPLAPEQKELLLNNDHITSNVKNFVVTFEDVLSEGVRSSPHYAYRVFFVRKAVNAAGQSDRIVEFLPVDSPKAKELEKVYALIKETERAKYLPSQIVSLMQSRGYSKFNTYQHSLLWKARDAKNPKYKYGVKIAKTWYWYEAWLREVEEYCARNSETFGNVGVA